MLAATPLGQLFARILPAEPALRDLVVEACLLPPQLQQQPNSASKKPSDELVYLGDDTDVKPVPVPAPASPPSTYAQTPVYRAAQGAPLFPRDWFIKELTTKQKLDHRDAISKIKQLVITGVTLEFALPTGEVLVGFRHMLLPSWRRLSRKAGLQEAASGTYEAAITFLVNKAIRFQEPQRAFGKTIDEVFSYMGGKEKKLIDPLMFQAGVLKQASRGIQLSHPFVGIMTRDMAAMKKLLALRLAGNKPYLCSRLAEQYTGVVPMNWILTMMEAAGKIVISHYDSGTQTVEGTAKRARVAASSR